VNEPLTNIAKTTTPMSVRNAIGRESAGFLAAEGVSIGVSLGVVAIADKLIPPDIMKNATQVVAKTCIEPFQDGIEKLLDKCKVHECRVDRTKTPEQRAEEYAKVLMVFSSAWVLSMVAKVHARRGLNHVLGVADEQIEKIAEDASVFKKIANHIPFVNWTKAERMIFMADEGVHLGLGGLILFNDKVAGFADDQITHMTNMMQKMGLPQQKAKEISNMAVIWETPNIAGALAGFTAISGRHAFGWPEKWKKTSFADVISGEAKTEHSVSL
jgi:hypothetical protein